MECDFIIGKIWYGGVVLCIYQRLKGIGLNEVSSERKKNGLFAYKNNN